MRDVPPARPEQDVPAAEGGGRQTGEDLRDERLGGAPRQDRLGPGVSQRPVADPFPDGEQRLHPCRELQRVLVLDVHLAIRGEPLQHLRLDGRRPGVVLDRQMEREEPGGERLLHRAGHAEPLRAWHARRLDVIDPVPLDGEACVAHDCAEIVVKEKVRACARTASAQLWAKAKVSTKAIRSRAGRHETFPADRAAPRS